MTTRDKLVLGSTMSLALAFGFLHVFVPDFALDFDRLHIFLFNLCSGGSVLLYFARGERRVSPIIYAYFALTLVYAASAFLELYGATLALSIPLVAIVESVRVRRFSFFPRDFFRPGSTSAKFLHAALLCLSIGIVIAAIVMINAEYLHAFSLRKLTLNVFFLGYSFPVSLMTFAVIFSFMRPPASRAGAILQELSFWIITLGVISFFVFIIFELAGAEIVISNILLAAVVMTYALFRRDTPAVQQKLILTSGMLFLIVTGLTGVFYLFDSFIPMSEAVHRFILVIHATVSLYGWNLSGIFIVVRADSYPIFKRPFLLVLLHWLSVFVLTPLGKYDGPIALAALAAYMVLVGSFFLTKSLKNAEAK
jgi:hypothetical protein